MIKLPSGTFLNEKYITWAKWNSDETEFAYTVLGATENSYLDVADGMFLERVLGGKINYRLQAMGNGD